MARLPRWGWLLHWQAPLHLAPQRDCSGASSFFTFCSVDLHLHGFVLTPTCMWGSPTPVQCQCRTVPGTALRYTVRYGATRAFPSSALRGFLYFHHYVYLYFNPITAGCGPITSQILKKGSDDDDGAAQSAFREREGIKKGPHPRGTVRCCGR